MHIASFFIALFEAVMIVFDLISAFFSAISAAGTLKRWRIFRILLSAECGIAVVVLLVIAYVVL